MPSFRSLSVIGAGAWGPRWPVSPRGPDAMSHSMRAAQRRGADRSNAGKSKIVRCAVGGEHPSDRRYSLAAAADIVLIATPAQNLRKAATALARHLIKATPVIACAKGIERGTHKFMTEVIAEAAPDARPAILSGPSFADDVARGLPTTVTLAANDEPLASALVRALRSSTFRPYHTSDVRGVEIGGAAKNVLAIAAEIVVGRNSAHPRRPLTTRGFSELVRLRRACGARGETMSGLSGSGDLDS